jgi:hypothetical protein
MQTNPAVQSPVKNLRSLAKDCLGVELPEDAFLAELLDQWSTDAILFAAAFICVLLGHRDFLTEFKRSALHTLQFFAVVDAQGCADADIAVAIFCWNEGIDLDIYRHMLPANSAAELEKLLAARKASES